MEDGSVTVLKTLLRDEGIGAWPAVDWLEPEPESIDALALERRLAKLRVYGVEPFFQLHVGQDERNSSVHVIQAGLKICALSLSSISSECADCENSRFKEG